MDWDLYIAEGKWTQINGQQRISWQNDSAHRVLEAMLTNYPHTIDRFDAGEASGGLKMSKGRFRSLITESRKLVGKDALPNAGRALSQHATIIVERQG